MSVSSGVLIWAFPMGCRDGAEQDGCVTSPEFNAGGSQTAGAAAASGGPEMTMGGKRGPCCSGAGCCGVLVTGKGAARAGATKAAGAGIC